MLFLAIVSLVTLCSVTCAPLFQPQLGIIASNSNEILGINGLALAGVGMGQGQGTPFLTPFLVQQPPPRVLNFSPGLQGPFLPPQMNPLNTLNPLNPINALNPAQMPQLQQDQPLPGIAPNNAIPAQSAPQGFPFFLPNFYPMRNMPAWMTPNQNPAPGVPGQNTLQPTQPIQNRGQAADPKVTSAPDYRGDRPGPSILEGNPGFPLFEP